MSFKHTYESVNTITWVPEGGAWGIEEDFRYAGRKRTGRKIIVVSLILGLFFAFYNPMVNYKPEVIHEVDISLVESDAITLPTSSQPIQDQSS